MDTFIQTLAVYAIPVLFGITLHEAAHGYVARYFGDHTAEQAGRISLNPIRHIDPIGTIAVPLFLLMTGTGVLFGWAKPVPVNWSRLRNPKKDILWVALAGPASNLLMFFLWAIALILLRASTDHGIFWTQMAWAGIGVNLVLMALNLLPFPPLDGGRVVYSLLPQPYAGHYARLEPYGLLILIVLMLTNVLSAFLTPIVNIGYRVVQFFL